MKTSKTIPFVAVLVLTASIFYIGYLTRDWIDTQKTQQTEDHSAEIETVWNTMNYPPDKIPLVAEERLGWMLEKILNPRSARQEVARALSLYSTKGFAYFQSEDTQRINFMLSVGPPEVKAVALRELAAMDSKAATLIEKVLSDTERISIFIGENSISLPDPALAPPIDAGQPPDAEQLDREPEEESRYHDQLQKDLDQKDKYDCNETSCTLKEKHRHE